MIKIIKKLFPENLLYKISLIYLKIFYNNNYIAHKDYVSTDFNQKCVHIMEAINYVKISQLPKVFFEFGCHSGRTFSAAIRASRELNILNETSFYAFDSFEGLPNTTAEDGIFKTGTFNTGENDFKKALIKQSNFILDESNIYKGFYSDTLTNELQNNMPKVGVVHIDVDIYSSAIEVLNFIKPLLVEGSVLIFDDYYCFPAGSNKGECKALNEFLENNKGFQVEEWKSYSSFGKSFFITSIG